MNIYEKLLNIQNELKAPKGQYNSFGKYKYRSCEDILEAVKPLCFKYKATLVLSDRLINIGDRYYIEASARLIDIEPNETSRATIIENTALARESLEKKGMDDSQITGTASSYARKYALNGLFNIDDTKDADTDEYKIQQDDNKIISKTQAEALETSIKNNMLDINGIDKEILQKYGYTSISEIKIKDYASIIADFQKITKKGE